MIRTKSSTSTILNQYLLAVRNKLLTPVLGSNVQLPPTLVENRLKRAGSTIAPHLWGAIIHHTYLLQASVEWGAIVHQFRVGTITPHFVLWGVIVNCRRCTMSPHPINNYPPPSRDFSRISIRWGVIVPRGGRLYIFPHFSIAV